MATTNIMNDVAWDAERDEKYGLLGQYHDYDAEAGETPQGVEDTYTGSGEGGAAHRRAGLADLFTDPIRDSGDPEQMKIFDAMNNYGKPLPDVGLADGPPSLWKSLGATRPFGEIEGQADPWAPGIPAAEREARLKAQKSEESRKAQLNEFLSPPHGQFGSSGSWEYDSPEAKKMAEKGMKAQDAMEMKEYLEELSKYQLDKSKGVADYPKIPERVKKFLGIRDDSPLSPHQQLLKIMFQGTPGNEKTEEYKAGLAAEQKGIDEKRLDKMYVSDGNLDEAKRRQKLLNQTGVSSLSIGKYMETGMKRFLEQNPNASEDQIAKAESRIFNETVYAGAYDKAKAEADKYSDTRPRERRDGKASMERVGKGEQLRAALNMMDAYKEGGAITATDAAKAIRGGLDSMYETIDEVNSLRQEEAIQRKIKMEALRLKEAGIKTEEAALELAEFERKDKERVEFDNAFKGEGGPKQARAYANMMAQELIKQRRGGDGQKDGKDHLKTRLASVKYTPEQADLILREAEGIIGSQTLKNMYSF